MEILPGFETFRPASLILSGRMIRCVCRASWSVATTQAISL